MNGGVLARVRVNTYFHFFYTIKHFIRVNTFIFTTDIFVYCLDSFFLEKRILWLHGKSSFKNVANIT